MAVLLTTRGGAVASTVRGVAHRSGSSARCCARSRVVSLSSSSRGARILGAGATSTGMERASARAVGLAPAGGRTATRSRLAPKALPDDVDWSAVRTYIYATVVQFGLMVATLKALDFIFPRIAWDALSKVALFGMDSSGWPQVAKNTVVFLFFLYMSFRCAALPLSHPHRPSRPLTFRRLGDGPKRIVLTRPPSRLLFLLVGCVALSQVADLLAPGQQPADRAV